MLTFKHKARGAIIAMAIAVTAFTVVACTGGETIVTVEVPVTTAPEVVV